MISQHRNKLLLLTLTVGYFGYRKALKQVIFENQNVFLNEESIEDLKQKNYVNIGGNRMLIGSIMNQTYRPEKKRIVIIGGGLIGASTAYELSKNPQYEVFMIEKHEEVGQETSKMNGTLICPSLSLPWISSSVLKKCVLSIINPEMPVSFSYKIFTEKYFGTWLLNSYKNLTESGLKEATRKLGYLAKSSMEEFKKLDKNYNYKDYTDRTSIGTLKVFTSEANFNSNQFYRDAVSEHGFKFDKLTYDEVKKIEPNLGETNYKFQFASLNKDDSNADSFKSTKLLADIAERNGAVIFKDVNFQRFLFERNSSKLIGVVTSQGTLLCDKVIISAGYYSKSIIDLLGIRLPLIPIQGYTFTIPNTKYKQNFRHNICDENGFVFLAPIKDKIRISGLADIGVNKEFDQKRLDLLINESKKIIGEFDETAGTHWYGVRPFTPDDVPIIGRVTGHNEIYLNTGHSSKGLTISLGSATLLSSIIENKAPEQLIKDYTIDRFYSI